MDFGDQDEPTRPASAPGVFVKQMKILDIFSHHIFFSLLFLFFLFNSHLCELTWKVSTWEPDKIELCTHVKKKREKKSNVENDNVLDSVPTKKQAIVFLL